MSEIAIGQEARLRGGMKLPNGKRPPMIVTALEGDVAICSWRDDSGEHLGDFSIAQLVPRPPKASDISDAEILAAVRKVKRDFGWSMLGDVEREFPAMPPKVVLAKLRSALRRKLLDGCGCGCRGDFREHEQIYSSPEQEAMFRNARVTAIQRGTITLTSAEPLRAGQPVAIDANGYARVASPSERPVGYALDSGGALASTTMGFTTLGLTVGDWIRYAPTAAPTWQGSRRVFTQAGQRAEFAFDGDRWNVVGGNAQRAVHAPPRSRTPAKRRKQRRGWS